MPVLKLLTELVPILLIFLTEFVLIELIFLTDFVLIVIVLTFLPELVPTDIFLTELVLTVLPYFTELVLTVLIFLIRCRHRLDVLEGRVGVGRCLQARVLP
jgi:hypothetical protein